MMNCVEEDATGENEALISYYDVQDENGNNCETEDKRKGVNCFFDTGA